MKSFKSFHTTFVFGLVSLLLVGCSAASRDTENYGDVAKSTGGIALTDPSEHPDGWGRRECFLCHNVAFNIHKNSEIKIDTTQETIEANGGTAYCLKCHGPNGL